MSFIGKLLDNYSIKWEKMDYKMKQSIEKLKNLYINSKVNSHLD